MRRGLPLWSGRASVRIRRSLPRDQEALIVLRSALWLQTTSLDQKRQVEALRRMAAPASIPMVTFVAETGEQVVGFADAGLRSHADGCDSRQPVGYLEGWYVDQNHRRLGLGSKLIAAVEAWSREQGCHELASDTWADNEPSHRAHLALGFEVVDRCITYRKTLGGVREDGSYGARLARIHHEHFGHVARAAAAELLRRLDPERGSVMDLGAGTGILSRIVSDAGYTVIGVDTSAAMLAIAREYAPKARFVEASLWDVAIPECVAVAAVGEALAYKAPSLEAFEDRLASFRKSLPSGGLLLFDLPAPGRSGPTGKRHGCWHEGKTCLTLLEREEAGCLHREISVFSPVGELHTRIDERHSLRTFDPETVARVLAAHDFTVECLAGYGEFTFPPGWVGFAARANTRVGPNPGSRDSSFDGQ